ncbi:MAG: hypothetical protein EXR99_07555 [Gemmataceae bacterium]|nr:hypothetical protein [Gemmataceae bacterium]
MATRFPGIIGEKVLYTTYRISQPGQRIVVFTGRNCPAADQICSASVARSAVSGKPLWRNHGGSPKEWF